MRPLRAVQTMTRAGLLGPCRLHPARGTAAAVRPAHACIIGTGSGSNPNLKPIISSNLDAGSSGTSRRARLLDADVFYMDLQNYVAFGRSAQDLHRRSNTRPPAGLQRGLRSVRCRSMPPAVSEGFEVNYQQAITGNFGVDDELHLRGRQADLARDDRRRPTDPSWAPRRTPTTSWRTTRTRTSARGWPTTTARRSSAALTATRRSRRTAIGTLAASLGWTSQRQLLDHRSTALNLNNPTLKYYALNDGPAARLLQERLRSTTWTLRFKL